MARHVWDLKGLKTVTMAFNKYVSNVDKNISEVIYDRALVIGELAQRRAPIESSDLRDSLQVFMKSKNLSIVSFGGEKTMVDGYDYAIRQHEDLTLRHSGPEHGEVDGGQAKYLETAFNDLEEQTFNKIKKAVEEASK